MCALNILPVEKIREADAYTIAHEPIKSIDLMERAARACTQWLSEYAAMYKNYKVLCGMGNNGGDGLAMARILHNKGLNVEVFYIKHAQQASADNLENFKKIANIPGLVVTEVFENEPLPEVEKGDVFIDALLGSGLNKPVTGFLAGIIKQVNESDAFIVSVDIPSGLFVSQSNDSKGAIIRADYTLSFQLPKLAFFIPENETYVGEWVLLDIGLDEEFIKHCNTNYYLTTQQDCKDIYRPRHKFDHKGTFGHALLIAGSLGKTGAAIMAAKACLRAGAGLVTAHIPLCAMDSMQSALPEAMVSIDESDTHFSALPDLSPYRAMAIGPGLGMHDESVKQLKLLIQEARRPLIMDADALNILAENKTWLPFMRPGTILTPHPKEFERLTSKVDNQYNRLEILQAFATRFQLYVILKGAYSTVACPDGSLYFNPTGNPGMATGGSGDVLTGILLGLLSSGYSPKEACILGVWLHGKAGDIAARKWSQPSLIASDIIQYLGKAFKKID